ncbi:MAG: TerC family protein [Syntrophobacteraceae bacterium]|nr:TerC family protein [Syntrophobacteraceae bacterium]
MHLGHPGAILTWTFFWDLLNILAINLVLSGDNAVVIAMAIRWLPPHVRKKGFILGAGAAVIGRIVLTFAVASVLDTPFVKLAGGIALLWIAVKLFVQGFPGEKEKEAATLFQAVRIMLVADLTMSLDNVLAIAGASRGNMVLLVLGLGTSIPFVIFTSGLLSMLMDRYPLIIYLGAALLGKVGAGMVASDPLVLRFVHPSPLALYGFEALCALLVIVIGKILLKRIIAADQAANAGDERKERTGV